MTWFKSVPKVKAKPKPPRARKRAVPHPHATHINRVLAVAATVEKRHSRAYVKSVLAMRAAIDKPALKKALTKKSVKGALAAIPRSAIKNALTPVANITRDSVERGGKLGATLVNETTSRR